jgi:transcription elongation factor GreA
LLRAELNNRLKIGLGITMDKVPVTTSGYANMEEEVRQLKTVERHAVIAAIAEAREHGDLSENAEYHAAREKQSFIEGRVLELEDKISRAEVIDVTKLTGDDVKFGSTVTVVDEDTDEEATYQIVGEVEADIKSNKLSITAPLARALVSKRAGTSVEVATPKGVKYYEILNIQYI